jgi:LacI family transcriptional regulator
MAVARPPTLRSLATDLGLSISTVSRAINGHPHVDEDVRERVLAAAERVGYAPDALARSLKAQRTWRVGLVLPDILNEFYTVAVAAIERKLAAAGYRLQLSIAGDDEALEAQQLEALLQERADGALLVPAGRRSAAVARLVAAGVPVVELGRRAENDGVHSVVAAERPGAVAATTHLLGLGHGRIAFIGGPDVHSTGRERLAGYRDALAMAGVPYDPGLVRQGPLQHEFGYEAALAALTQPDPPTAVLAASNQLVFGLLRAAAGLGLSVPDALSVVAFGHAHWFAVANPPVTSVMVPIAEMAAAAAGLLRRHVELAMRQRDGAADPATADASGRPIHQVFDAPLVVRGTTARPRPPGTRAGRQE